MAQFARPSADTLRDNWDEDDGTTTSIFSEIDESSVDDADFIRSQLGPTSDVYVTKLTSVTDPSASSGHIVRYRIGKDLTAGNQIDFLVELRQGYVDETTKGTLIEDWTHTNVDALTTYAQTLSGAAADLITDYADLYLRFMVNEVAPVVGTTFFSATAESGIMIPPWPSWGVVNAAGDPAPTTSTAKAKNGTRSFLFAVTTPGQVKSSRVLSGGPTVSMGSANGGYTTGYYSFYMYVDSGFDGTSESGVWNLLHGWMTGTPNGNPAPIGKIGMEKRGGVLQLYYQATAVVLGGCFVAPTITGYQNFGTNGYYYQAAGSPNGITAVPRSQWVFVCIYFKMAATDGQVTVWQDNVKVIDLTAPTLNTLIGHGGAGTVWPCVNPNGDMIIQMGIYGGAGSSVPERLYIDDYKVTDYQVTGV